MSHPALQLPVQSTTRTSPANDTHDDPVFVLPALPTDRDITLAVLAGLFTGAPDADCREIHLRHYTEDGLVNEGNKVDTQRILDAVPRILVWSMHGLACLTPEQAPCVVFDTALIPLIVHESVKLAALHGRFLATKPARAVRQSKLVAGQKERHAAAVLERDLVCAGLEQVLGPSVGDEFDPARDASSEAALCAGLRHLADVIDQTLTSGTDVERRQLTRRRLGAERAASLRAMADTLSGARIASTASPPPPAVTQRALDHQDGVVLVLLDALVDGMKLLRRACPLVERPTYGTLSGRYVTRPGGGRAPKSKEGAPDAPVAQPPVK